MRRRQGSGRRLLAAGLVSIGLIAAACSNKKDEDTTAPTEAPATSSAETTATTTASSTATSESTPATEAPSTTTAAAEVQTGGKLVISGEAEVTNPWDPASMQCDSYCYQRAFTFFDPLMVVGQDLKAHPFLLESMTPNSDYTQWTMKVRSGISFTDGTPLNADAVIKNLQRTGNSLLVGAAVLDLAKVPSATDPSKMVFKIDKVDDMTLTIYTGENGDPNKPLPWPDFPLYLTGQIGLIGSPAWEDAVDADPSKAAAPIGTGPFTVESYAPRDKLVVKKNPNYWLKDAQGRQLPYLDEIEFRVIEDSEIAGQALDSGDLDIFSTSDGNVIADFRQKQDQFPMVEQNKYTETDFYLIDLTKAPLDDQRVRCALSKAIDRQELVDAVDGGIQTPANGVFSPGRQGYLADNGFDIAQDVEGAKALIAEYQAEHPGDVVIHYGTTNTAGNAQRAELLKGYWEAIGVKFDYIQVPQDSFITDALFGNDNFYIFGWRQYGGFSTDALNFWWNSRGSHPDGQLSLNFPRMNDPQVDALLAQIRTTTDEAARTKASEDLNKLFAEKCYFIPEAYTLWGTPHKTSVAGLGTMPLPDGATAQDGAGFPGQFWTTTLWVNPDA